MKKIIILSIISITLFAGIFEKSKKKRVGELYPRLNPIDLEAENYEGHEMVDNDGDGEPDFNITWNGGNVVTTNSNITIQVSGVALKYMISTDPGFSGAVWQTFANTIDFTLVPPNGPRNIYLKFTYLNAEDGGVEGDKVYTGTVDMQIGSFIFDYVWVDCDGMHTNVSLESSIEGADWMRVANESNFSGAVWIPFTNMLDWTLIADNTLNTKTVYFQFSNIEYQSVSPVYSDSPWIGTISAFFSNAMNGGNPTNQIFYGAGGAYTLEYRWDFYSDGIWDTGWQSSNTYTWLLTNIGEITNRLEMRNEFYTVAVTNAALFMHTWTRIFNGPGNGIDKAESVIQATDGGYAVTGRASTTGKDDIWVLKLDASGRTNWTVLYSGGIDDDWPYSIIQTMDGGFVVAGSSDTGPECDGFVMKISSNGITNWIRLYNGPSNDFDYVNSIIQLSDGGYIAAGTVNAYGSGDSDVWVLKLNSNGNTNWVRQYDGAGNGGDWGQFVIQSLDGGYVVGGNTFNGGDKDVWLLKLDTNGNTNWATSFDYGGNADDNLNDLIQIPDGRYIVAGQVVSGSHYIAIFGSNGNILNQYTVSGAYRSVIQSTDGSIVAAGNSGLDVIITKMDIDGNVIWSWRYDKPDNTPFNASSIVQTTDGGYVVAGHYDGSDFLIMKLSPDGQLLSGSAGYDMTRIY